MKSLLKNSILSLFSACLLTACNEHTVYHSYQSLPNKGWGKSDTLSFQIPITDSVPTSLRLFAEVNLVRDKELTSYDKEQNNSGQNIRKRLIQSKCRGNLTRSTIQENDQKARKDHRKRIELCHP